MQQKQGSLLAVALLMMAQNAQALQLTSNSVVGNVLFEQGSLYVLALLILLASLVL
jgi:uncharacterized membrane protein YgdD (TMEM256/DUF423 family)